MMSSKMLAKNWLTNVFSTPSSFLKPAIFGTSQIKICTTFWDSLSIWWGTDGPALQALKELPVRSHIGVKRMGELNSEPFLEAMKLRYDEDEAENKASEMCSLWEEYLRDPGWHPFRTIEVDEEAKVHIRQMNWRCHMDESKVPHFLAAIFSNNFLGTFPFPYWLKFHFSVYFHNLQVKWM